LLPGQRTFLVPWAWALPSEVTSDKLYITAVERIKEAALYHDLAAGNPRIVGFMPFLFQDVTDSGGSGRRVHGIPGLRCALQWGSTAQKTGRPQKPPPFKRQPVLEGPVSRTSQPLAHPAGHGVKPFSHFRAEAASSAMRSPDSSEE